MNRVLFAIAIINLSIASAFAQARTATTSSQPREMIGAVANSTAIRARALERASQPALSREDHAMPSPGRFANGEIVLNNAALGNGHASVSAPLGTVTSAAGKKTRPRTTAGMAATPSPALLTQIYRVGVGDVLDVRLVDMPTVKSTLFTVLEGGRLDYPLAGDSLPVAGLTAEEIAAQLRSHIKVLENPLVLVKVRDYASHNVLVTGLVANPGTRFLRRESTPLYVVLSEAGIFPEAGRATIARAGQPPINIDLSDQNSAATVLMPGDMIRVFGVGTEAAGFFYTGGALNAPGQKAFHSGMTLTQAILASGGLTRGANTKVKVSRQATDGCLVTSEYNLRQIEDGKLADPILQRGDRITVSESR